MNTKVEGGRIQLHWSSAILLRHSLEIPENGPAGIYLWGFKNRDREVLWYVGKATARTGVYRRLRQHFLNAMSGQYQIPQGFLNGEFVSDECSKSGWSMTTTKGAVRERLASWDSTLPILKAAHSFANSCFARFAEFGGDAKQLSQVESAVIRDLKPLINKRRGSTRLRLEHLGL